MSTTTTTKRPATFTKSAWEKATFHAFLALIDLVQGKTTVSNYLTDNAILFKASGVPADEKHVLSLLISMAKDRTEQGDKVRHVMPISYLRSYFNGGWVSKDALRITATIPTAPKTTATKAPKKAQDSVTKWFGTLSDAEKQAFIAKLMGEAA